MKCLFFDLPVKGTILSPNSKSTETILRECGGNTGNLVFRNAISKQVQDELIPCHWKDGLQLASQEKFDCAVLAGANWLNTSHAFGNEKRAEVLRELALPIVCIGLGVQHDREVRERLEFPAATRSFLQVLRDLNASVLVRDQTTLAQCRHYGLTRVEVTGCPSNFTNLSSTLAETLLTKAEKGIFRTVTLNRGYFSTDCMQHDREIMKFMYGGDGVHVVQTNERGLLSLALGREEEVSVSDQFYLKRRYRVMNFLPGRYSWRTFKDRLCAYLDVDGWLADAATWDIALGSRIHGAMVALQAGTPAILSGVDSRTDGLAKEMCVPHLPLREAMSRYSAGDLNHIVHELQPDFSGYLNRRSVLASRYVDIIREFGLHPVTALDELAERR
jgi:hypothetical protein